MTILRRLAPALAAFAGLLAAPRAAVAQAEPDPAKQRAAAAFEEGVARFGRAEYEAAARAFLRADDEAPSSRALLNAIAAGRRASDHLLVAGAAERAIGRAGADEALATAAREALAEAAGSLARIDLHCEASPCALRLDDAPAKEGAQYAVPGSHHVVAEGAAGARAEQRLSCIAGATYRVVLHPAAETPAGQQPAAPPLGPPPPPPAPPRGGGLSPALFFTGLGVTVVLAGFTTGSGLDAISAKNGLGPSPLQSQLDSVLSRARRTDVLLGGTLLAGVATSTMGLFFVDWHGRRMELGPGSGPSALGLEARARF
jgi:hypothetical protein